MRRTKQFYRTEPKHLERLVITGVAIFAVFAATLVKAAVLGEFNWLVGA